jgi:hypothetical protein
MIALDKVVELATLFHEEWRKLRLKPDGTYEPRMKEDNGNAIDIANTAYKDLPEKWQAENRAAAYILVQLLDMESLAAQVHNAWACRNTWSELAKIPYAALPEEEKEKDRAQVRAAMNILLK